MALGRIRGLKNPRRPVSRSLANCLLLGVVVSGISLGPLGDSAGAQTGEQFTPPAKGERRPDRLKVGDPAPDFTLPDPTGKKDVTLSSFKNKKPVVLVFGSCT